MSQKDFHPMFNTSTALLLESIEKHAQIKKIIEDAEDHDTQALKRISNARQKADDAIREVDKQKAALVTAVGTPDEEAVLAALQLARSEYQRSKDLVEALSAAHAGAPNLKKEEDLVERYRVKAQLAMVGEELNKLPEGTLECLYRSFAAYEGGFDWQQFLVYILPQQDTRVRARLCSEVRQSYGLDM